MRTDILQQFRRPHPTQGLSGYWRGRVSEAPATVYDPMYVVIEAFAKEFRFGPCRWMPRVYPINVDVAEGGLEGAHIIEICRVLMPVRGDLALTVFDNIRAPWVVSWWPKAHEHDGGLP